MGNSRKVTLKTTPKANKNGTSKGTPKTTPKANRNRTPKGTPKLTPTNKTIPQFFSTGASSTVAVAKSHTNKVSHFYSSRVVDQLKNDECDDHACENIKRELQQQLALSKEKLVQTKKAVDVCKHIIQQKECKLNSLKRRLNQQLQTLNRKVPEEYFNSYKNDFTSKGLSELRSIGGKKKDDSNFILTGIRLLYRNELHRLGAITVTGRSRKKMKTDANAVRTNEKLSPKKLNAMKGAFEERLEVLQLEEKVHKQRAARINILINNALQKLNPNKHLKQSLDELNKQINLADNLLD